MKKEYKKPQAEKIEFDYSAQVVTTSGCHSLTEAIYNNELNSACVPTGSKYIQ